MVYNLYTAEWTKTSPPDSGSWILDNLNTITATQNDGLIGIDIGIFQPISGIALYLDSGLSNKNWVGISNQSKLKLFTSSNLSSTLIGYSQVSGNGGAGILNMLDAYIVTGSANDYIEGYSLTKEASGISNQGIIGTGNGNDFIYGSASAGGTRFGLENDGGIVTGSSVGSPDEDCDTIIGSGQNTIGGLLNRGVILTGIGNDQILAYTKVTIMSGGDGPVNAGLLSGIGTAAILNNHGSIDTGNDNDTIAGSAYGWGHGIYNESGSIVTGSGGDTITGYASGSGRIGIYNSGSVNTVNGGTNSDVDTIAGTANGNSSKGIANYGNINNDYSRLPSSVNKVQITGQSNGISSVGLYNMGNIATGNEKDIISGIATGTSSVGILNDGFYAQRPQPEWIYASIGSVANEASKIIGKATGTGTTGILNRGLIYLGVDVLTGLSSPKSASITGSSSGGVGSYGIKNDSSIYTGAGSDFITGTTAGVGGIGIYNDGLISTGAGNDTISTRLGNKYSDFGGSNGAKRQFDLGSDNDTVDGFGRGSFDGGDGSDTIKLPELTAGQFYTVSYSYGWGSIKRSTDNVIMGFTDFETLSPASKSDISLNAMGTQTILY